jgi:hypothetical protein
LKPWAQLVITFCLVSFSQRRVFYESPAVSTIRVKAYFESEDGGNIFHRSIGVHPKESLLLQIICPLFEDVSNPVWNPIYPCLIYGSPPLDLIREIKFNSHLCTIFYFYFYRLKFLHEQVYSRVLRVAPIAFSSLFST